MFSHHSLGEILASTYTTHIGGEKKRQLRCFESEIAINTKDTSLEKRPLGKNPFCVSAITILKTYRFNPQKN